MHITTLVKAIADAARRSTSPGTLANPDLHKRIPEYLAFLEQEFLPRGSGFDSGTKIQLDACTDSKVVFTTSFHHMNDGGFYDGWTEHKVVIYATFDGLSIRITGRDRNQIKDYIADSFRVPMHREVLTFWYWATNN